MAQLTYNLTEHPNGLPASYRLFLLPLTAFPKSATTTLEPGMDVTDYAIFAYPIQSAFPRQFPSSC